MSTNQKIKGIGRLLKEERLGQMFQEFSTWRIDPFIREMEAKRQKGRVLAFVRGLRLSAHLIYTIREILSGTNLTADWGHLLDESEDFCSCECDVIIHRKGWFRRWNGTHEPVMDFQFIKQSEVVAVISCKSYLRAAQIDEEYCTLMKPFVKRIWLFAECCGPRSIDNIQEKAFRFGYEKFWHLYTWSKQKDCEPNKDGWNSFVTEVKKLNCIDSCEKLT
jgi:hypothetical protein